MATDRLGLTIATGDILLLAAAARRIAGTEVLAVAGPNGADSLRVAAGDVVHIDAMAPTAYVDAQIAALLALAVASFQAKDYLLTALASLTPAAAADKLAYLTGGPNAGTTAAIIDFKSWAQTFIASASAAAGRASIGAAPQVLQFANTSNGSALTAADTSKHAFGPSFTIPANDLAAGDVLEVECAGYMTGGASATNFTLGLQAGTAALATAGATGMAKSVSNIDWRARVTIHVYSIGASGVLDCRGIWLNPSSATVCNAVVMPGANATVTIDTTTTQALQFFGTFGTANGSGYSFTIQQFSVKRFR